MQPVRRFERPPDMTRRLIERELDAIDRRVRRQWRPYAAFAGALVVGMVLSRVPVWRLLGAGARAVLSGVALAGAVAAVAVRWPNRDGRPDVNRA